MNGTADEFSLIRKISERLGNPGPRVEVGIGDDAAVLIPPQGKMLFCSDAMVEGIHFDLSYTSPADLGHKALASCLSDIAAMNGQPLYALISLALPEKHRAEFLDEFYDGASQLTQKFGVDIVGGDLSSSKSGIFVDVACVGETSRPLTRAGARPGDLLAVSGLPGSAAAGLFALQNYQADKVPPALRNAHLRPTPRFDLLSDLANHLCTAMIDVSDGISSEAHHLARQSRVGFVIEAAKIPLAPLSRHLAAARGKSALDWALSGGEDYELLATFDPTKGLPATGWTVIGTAVPASAQVTLVGLDGKLTPLKAGGYRHFASS